jgi:hypothetical protein
MRSEYAPDKRFDSCERKLNPGTKMFYVGSVAVALLALTCISSGSGIFEQKSENTIGTTSIEDKEPTVSSKFEELLKEDRLTEIILPQATEQTESNTPESKSGSISLSLVVPVMLFKDEATGEYYTNVQCGDDLCKATTAEQAMNEPMTDNQF